MLIHGDCSGLRHCPKNCIAQRCAPWHERTRQGVAACADQMTQAGLGQAMPLPSALVMDSECKACGKSNLSEFSQKSDEVLKRCGDERCAACASLLCGLASSYRMPDWSTDHELRAPGHIVSGACRHPAEAAGRYRATYPSGALTFAFITPAFCDTTYTGASVSVSATCPFA
jgi:hypothetical protein